MTKNGTKTNYYWTSGRRKTAVARVRMAQGKGEIIVNDRPFTEYFPQESDRLRVLMPFQETGLSNNSFDISVKAQGGGKKAQVDAVMLGIAKALVQHDENFRKLLSKKGFLTRDPRMKERKKIGLHKARRAHQFSKR